MRIGFDVDGVLANFFTPYESLMIEVSGVNLFPKRYPYALPPTWNWPEFYGYLPADVAKAWAIIKSNTTFWRDMELLPDAAQTLKRVQDMVGLNDVYYITDRPGLTAQAQTAQWFKTKTPIQLPSVIISNPSVGATKGAICAALGLEAYIDDKPANIDDVLLKSPTTQVFMVKYPYNASRQEEFVGKDVVLVDSPIAFAKAVMK